VAWVELSRDGSALVEDCAGGRGFFAAIARFRPTCRWSKARPLDALAQACEAFWWLDVGALFRCRRAPVRRRRMAVGNYDVNLRLATWRARPGPPWTCAGPKVLSVALTPPTAILAFRRPPKI